MHALDRSMIGGREVSVCMSRESRKTPREMIRREGGDRRDRACPLVVTKPVCGLWLLKWCRCRLALQLQRSTQRAMPAPLRSCAGTDHHLSPAYARRPFPLPLPLPAPPLSQPPPSFPQPPPPLPLSQPQPPPSRQPQPQPGAPLAVARAPQRHAPRRRARAVAAQ